MTSDRSVLGEYVDAGDLEADSLKVIPTPRYHLESSGTSKGPDTSV